MTIQQLSQIWREKTKYVPLIFGQTIHIILSVTDGVHKHMLLVLLFMFHDIETRPASSSDVKIQNSSSGQV